MRFSEFLLLGEDRADSPYYSYTGKGFVDGTYVGGPCRWRDDPRAFASEARPRTVDLPDARLPPTREAAQAATKEKAKEVGSVDVPGFETVVVGRKGLDHGVRYYSMSATRGETERLNFAAAMAVADVLRNSVPREFRPADASDRGKPVKGIVVLEGAVRCPDGKVRPVRSVVSVSAACDFRRDGGWEQREIYTLHSIQVLKPGADPLGF